MRRTIVAIPWVFGLAGIGAVSVSDTLRRYFRQMGTRPRHSRRRRNSPCGRNLESQLLLRRTTPKLDLSVYIPKYYLEALDAANAFDDPGTIYYYSGRRTFSFETIRFLYSENRGIDRSHEFGAFDLEKRHPGPVTYLLEDQYMQEIDTIMECIPAANSSSTPGTSHSTSCITSQAEQLQPPTRPDHPSDSASPKTR